MFVPEPGQSYMMPAHFGPRYTGPKSSGWYHDVTMMVVPYVTDRQQLASHLPEHFEPADDAVVTVYYCCNRKVDWLAGRSYNMIGVNADVRYESQGETLEGTYCLVIWENLTDPILTGRELQGIPKVYGDIPDHSVIDGGWRANASHFGNKIVDMKVEGLRAPELEEIAAGAAAKEGKDNPMGWQYMAQPGVRDAAVSQYTTYPSESHFTQVMLGSGEVSWKSLTWEDNPTQYHIVNALHALPVLEYRTAMVTQGSANLILPDRMTRVLKS